MSQPRGRFGPILVAAAVVLSGLLGSTRAEANSDAACTGCHQALSPAVIEGLKHSAHRPREPGKGPPSPGCVDCHGPGKAHLSAPGAGEKGPERVFGHGPGAAPVDTQNAVCMQCHQGRDQQHWEGSSHQREGLICGDCHQIHKAVEPESNPQAAVEACLGCHPRQRAEIHYASAHPLAEGSISCSDCHNPHGEPASGQAVPGLANDTCFRCHADKRGPFLWEHPPVSEDCSLCHRPHGSPHPALLVARTPWLCQQCHLAQFHPSTAYSGTGLPGDTRPSGAQSLLAKNCMNCHAQVHGSNHPSGARQTR